jgi:sulfate adenylyltransferase
LNNQKESLLISPYGGELIDLRVEPEALKDLREEASRLPSLQLSDRSVCDLELLAIGAFSPLKGFMGSQDFQSVLDHMRLSDGHIFPIPVTLPVAADADIHPGQDIALCDTRNNLLAVMTVEEIYVWDHAVVSR